jgi:hypothetical protein
MQSSATPIKPSTVFLEVDYRESDGLEVWILLNRPGDYLTIFVSDARTNDALEFVVDPHAVHDAFAHPFAFATTQNACSILDASCPAADRKKLQLC